MRGIERIVRGRLHYGWIVAGVTFLTLLASAGIRSTPGILIIPLEKEFGWTRATVSFAVSINILLYGLFGPFAAALMDRVGVRRVIVMGLLTASTATGQLLFLPFLASLVVTSGWRWAVLAVAGVALLMVPLVYIFMRNDPSDVGLRPVGATADVAPVSSGANPAAAAL